MQIIIAMNSADIYDKGTYMRFAIFPQLLVFYICLITLSCLAQSMDMPMKETFLRRDLVSCIKYRRTHIVVSLAFVCACNGKIRLYRAKSHGFVVESYSAEYIIISFLVRTDTQIYLRAFLVLPVCKERIVESMENIRDDTDSLHIFVFDALSPCCSNLIYDSTDDLQVKKSPILDTVLEKIQCTDMISGSYQCDGESLKHIIVVRIFPGIQPTEYGIDSLSSFLPFFRAEVSDDGFIEICHEFARTQQYLLLRCLHFH